LVSLIGRYFLSEVHNTSILRTGLSVAPSLSYPLATRPPGSRPPRSGAGAERLRALAQGFRGANARFPTQTARSEMIATVSNGSIPVVRLTRLLVTIPLPWRPKALSLASLQASLRGRGLGNCHPGELGAASAWV
jgi:hypothetical protein